MIGFQFFIKTTVVYPMLAIMVKNLAKGDYIAFVDSDDYVHPDMYRRLVSVMDDKKC